MDVTACDLSSGANLARWPGGEPDEAEARGDFAQFLATELGEVETAANNGLPVPAALVETAPQSGGPEGVQPRPGGTAEDASAAQGARGPADSMTAGARAQSAERPPSPVRTHEGAQPSDPMPNERAGSITTASDIAGDAARPQREPVESGVEMQPGGPRHAAPRSAAARALLAALAVPDADTRGPHAQPVAGDAAVAAGSRRLEETAPGDPARAPQGQPAGVASLRGVAHSAKADAVAAGGSTFARAAAETGGAGQSFDAHAGTSDQRPPAQGHPPAAATQPPVSAAPAAAASAEPPPATPAPVQAAAAVVSGAAPRIQAPSTPLAPDVPEPVQQIVSALRLQVRDGVTEARVRLRPEHLGEVQIAIRLDRGRVSAVLHVERADVRGLIEAQSQALRAQLAAHGLHLEDLSVREDGRNAQHQGHEPRSRQEGRRQRPDPGHAFLLPDDL